MPSYETNPFTAIASTRDVACKNHIEDIHVSESVCFGFVVIDHFVRIPQHAIVGQTAMIFG